MILAWMTCKPATGWLRKPTLISVTASVKRKKQSHARRQWSRASHRIVRHPLSSARQNLLQQPQPMKPLQKVFCPDCSVYSVRSRAHPQNPRLPSQRCASAANVVIAVAAIVVAVVVVATGMSVALRQNQRKKLHLKSPRKPRTPKSRVSPSRRATRASRGIHKRPARIVGSVHRVHHAVSVNRRVISQCHRPSCRSLRTQNPAISSHHKSRALQPKVATINRAVVAVAVAVTVTVATAIR